MENKVPFRLYLGFHRKDFTAITHLEPSNNALQVVHVSLKSINNEGQYACRTK